MPVPISFTPSLYALALATSALPASQPAPGTPRITETLIENDREALPGNVHALLANRVPLGPTDGGQPMERMILALKVGPESRDALEKLLAGQQDPGSLEFHKWLTPEQFAERFGPSREDLAKVVGWLAGLRLTVDEIAAGGLSITFSGDVAAVEHAFRTTIMDFDLMGRKSQGNVTDPSIPKALAGVVCGVVSLHDVPRRALNRGLRKLPARDAEAVAAGKPQPAWRGEANGGKGVYMGPKDWAGIYNAGATCDANGDGTGAVIGIVGRTNPGTSNWATFRKLMGLPLNTPAVVVNGKDPGDAGAAEDGEADLDAEWAGGVAPGAKILFVASQSTKTTDGVDLSAQYLVNHNSADVVSLSFGQCESTLGAAENTFYKNLWAQAAAEGITVCVSSGDSGPAGCGNGSDDSGAGQAGVNGLATTPNNIAVGATQLSISNTYWTTGGSPNGYIPERPWNESSSVTDGSQLWATGSGPSGIYPKPSWQAAPGVPAANHRYTPDICLDGSDMFFGNYGILVYSQGGLATTGGTSVSAPCFAGVMALVVQAYGRQGNPAATLYQLGAAQYSGTGPAVFHDIVEGNNTVPGLKGYTAGPGWDEVTGLGTPDVAALVSTWGGGTLKRRK